MDCRAQVVERAGTSPCPLLLTLKPILQGGNFCSPLRGVCGKEKGVTEGRGMANDPITKNPALKFSAGFFIYAVVLCCGLCHHEQDILLINTSQLHGAGYFINSHNVSGNTHAYTIFLRSLVHAFESLFHYTVSSAVNALFCPEVT